MGKNGDVPRFFSLPQSSKISFKVGSKNSRRRKLPDGNYLPDDAIAPRLDFTEDFELAVTGNPRIFTPEQTYNYKSAWKRYEKGVELVEDGKVIKDDNNDGNTEDNNNSYKVLSRKSPKGYWEVKRKPSIPPQSNVDIEFVYGVSHANFRPYPETDTLLPHTSSEDSSISGNSITYNFQLTELGYYAEMSLGLAILIQFHNLPQGSSATINASFTYDENSSPLLLDISRTFGDADGDILHIDRDYLNLNNFSFDLTDYPDYQLYIKAFVLYVSPNTEDDESLKTISFNGNITIAVTPGSTDDDEEDDDGGDGGDGDGGNNNNNNKWQCDCPDSSNKKSLNPNDTSGNENLLDDWTDSDAGAQNGECKHIWAVRILRREIPREDIPTDMPISENFPNDNGASREPRVIGGQGGIGFDNWNPNKQRKK